MKKESMKNNYKKIPKFKNEEQERNFWARNDSSNYINWTESKKIKFPNLKPATKPISIRLPVALIEKLKTEANKKDIPYQSYLKMLLYQKLESKV